MVDVKDCTNTFIQEVNEELQWQYLKSARSLKKKIKDVVFQINFHSSKYNTDSRVELNCECQVWCRAYNKVLCVDSSICYFSFLKERKEYWWDITNLEEKEAIKAELVQQIKEKLLPIVTLMENDFVEGAKALVKAQPIGAWGNSLRFTDEYIGREEAVLLAEQFVMTLTDNMKQCAHDYLQGTQRLANERNLRYILDNDLVKVE